MNDKYVYISKEALGKYEKQQIIVSLACIAFGLIIGFVCGMFVSGLLK